ncbi:hypothetical protein V1477_011851 [Vespula maculifrons]|uniref:C2H2-type domain-containing protein n=1 Tax=Vespula maculifrons TaxID=7453 RepID=A0ABD2C0D0_VESMC
MMGASAKRKRDPMTVVDDRTFLSKKKKKKKKTKRNETNKRQNQQRQKTCDNSSELGLLQETKTTFLFRMRQGIQMDIVVDQTRERRVRKGSATCLSRMRNEDTSQVDVEETFNERSRMVHGNVLIMGTKKAHRYTRWLPIKYYGCKNCGKKYKWKDSLIRHHRYVCGKDPQHSCPICGIKIRYKWLLKKHLIDTHEWKIPKGIHI